MSVIIHLNQFSNILISILFYPSHLPVSKGIRGSCLSAFPESVFDLYSISTF